MSSGKTDLSRFNNDWFQPGAGKIKMVLWYLVNVLFFINPLNPISSLKVQLLRLFGARIGVGVMIKPGVNIKYPWKLSIGDWSWIGENVWIDNLEQVSIGANCCLSQGALLLCGSHDYKLSTFDLIAKPITIEDGAWAGANTVVCGGVTMESHSVLAVNSVATKDLAAYTIYQGNPAEVKRVRTIS
jgi:putative colanic acid biosynthesis acetyltransferase WcaF